MLVRVCNKRVSERRRLLNHREYNLLNYLITQTEPSDPFSDSPSRKINLSELKESRYIRAVYAEFTPRTFARELDRLSELGFITLKRDPPVEGMVLELDFDAIAKY
jgi:hypothetical protein